MSKDLREKFRAPKIAELKKQVDEENSNLYSGNSEWLPTEQGQNKFRLLPAEEGKKWQVMRSNIWLRLPNDDGTEGFYRSTANNARSHYKNPNTGQGAKFDLIEEYIKAAKTLLENSHEDGVEKKIATLTHWKDGLSYNTNWVVYALLVKGSGDKAETKFGKLEMRKSMRDWVNKEALTQEEDDPEEEDPFTGLDNGYCVIVTYDKNAKKAADKYTYVKSKKPFPLTDEHLEELADATPLEELDIFAFTAKDFQKQLDAIKLYDDEQEIGLFEEDEWLERVEKIKSQFHFFANESDDEDEAEEDDEDEEEVKAPTKSAAKNTKSKAPVVVEDTDDEEDEDEAGDEDEKPAKGKTAQTSNALTAKQKLEELKRKMGEKNKSK